LSQHSMRSMRKPQDSHTHKLRDIYTNKSQKPNIANAEHQQRPVRYRVGWSLIVTYLFESLQILFSHQLDFLVGFMLRPCDSYDFVVITYCQVHLLSLLLSVARMALHTLFLLTPSVNLSARVIT
jgi:hypothetical protein